MSISSQSARGASVFTLINFATYALSFVATIIAARILGPADFGQATLAITIADILVIAGAWSLPTALLREPEESVDVAFSTAIYLALILSAGVLALAAIIGVVLALFGLGLVGQMLFAVMVGRVCAVVGSCYSTDLSRRFIYGRFSFIGFSTQVTGNVVTIALAAAGVGAWALAARDVVAGLLTLPISIALSRWKLTRRYSRAKARELLDFVRKMIGSRLGDLMFHRYDNLVVAALAGNSALGLYSQAYVIAEIGNRVYAPTLLQVGMSNYARTQGDRAYTTRTFNFVTYFLYRTIPLLFVVLVVCPELVLQVLFGSEWVAAAEILRALSVYALLLPVFDHMRALLIANGLVMEVLKARAIQLGVFLPLVPVLTWAMGAEGAAVAVAVAMVIGTAAMGRQCRALVDSEGLRQVVSPVLAAFAGAAVLAVVISAIGNDLLAIVAGTTAMTATYGAVLYALDGRRLRENVATLRQSLRPAPVDEG